MNNIKGIREVCHWLLRLDLDENDFVENDKETYIQENEERTKTSHCMKENKGVQSHCYCQSKHLFYYDRSLWSSGNMNGFRGLNSSILILLCLHGNSLWPRKRSNLCTCNVLCKTFHTDYTEYLIKLVGHNGELTLTNWAQSFNS